MLRFLVAALAAIYNVQSITYDFGTRGMMTFEAWSDPEDQVPGPIPTPDPNRAHYRKPPDCGPDEVVGTVPKGDIGLMDDGGQFCAPRCTQQYSDCPSDIPEGKTGRYPLRACILVEEESLCVLSCDTDDDCAGDGAFCSYAVMQTGSKKDGWYEDYIGICTYQGLSPMGIDYSKVDPQRLAFSNPFMLSTANNSDGSRGYDIVSWSIFCVVFVVGSSAWYLISRRVKQRFERLSYVQSSCNLLST
eukprot:gnl/MRDRNA2_/MRDRNA2_28410_c0_seq1.p1 gnl/MRDRNA2_/MRDRNA2_28410_c0~~gnl/MRDRNA2_/MRDRNA2_28410_c0_seq1.p1  ORF type:complete len:246 (-),score=31.70 gnl/MRDRNA2_/MRDRNA2_28410_c0_seq1:136-873(-)